MLFVNPEYVMILYNVNHLKDIITDKIVEKDYLINYYCKDLKIDYMLKIGALEYKKLLAENQIKILKRKINLINQLKCFNEIELDNILKKEFEEDKKIEKEMFKDINIAIEYSLKEKLTEEEIEELNLNYSMLVRTWNPNLNLNLDERKQKLYETTENAYIEGNIKLLENYVKLIEEDEIIQQGELNELKAENERYTKLFGEINEVIRIIKNSFPYNEKDTLENENLIRRRKDNINEEIRQGEIQIKELEKEVTKLLKGKN